MWCFRLIILYYVYVCVLSSFFEERVAVIESYDVKCYDNKKGIMYYENFGLRTRNNKAIIENTIVITEDINHMLKMVVTIYKCKSKSCEKFSDFVSDKYCNIIKSNSPLWKPFFTNYKPKLRCPLKKGIYVSKSSEINISTFLMLPLDKDLLWHVNCTIYDTVTKEPVMCVNTYSRIKKKDS